MCWGLTDVFECCRAQCRHACSARSLCAFELEELGVPWLDTSFVSDNKYALGIMQFETRAVANHALAQMARQWSWAAKNQFAAEYMHVRAHTVFAGNEFADVGAEMGRRLQCMSLSWLWTSVSAREEAVAISLYDALWWTDQLAKLDPMTERDGTRPSVERRLVLCVGSANVRTLSPATDEPEVHSVRGRVLADAFSRKHIDVVGLQWARAQFDISCVWWFSHGQFCCCVWAGRGRDLD